MLTSNLLNALNGIIPFLTNNMLFYLKLGNEYNILIYVIITIIFRDINEYLNDYIIILIIVIIIYIYIYDVRTILNYINIFKCEKIIIEGSLIMNNNMYSIMISDKIKALNNYLLENKLFSNIIYINEREFYFDEKLNIDICNNLKLSIKNIPVGNNYKISYILQSNKTQYIEQILNEIMDNYKKKMSYNISFVGYEDMLSISYPKQIKALNYYLRKNYFNSSQLKFLYKQNISISNSSNNDNKINTDKNELESSDYECVIDTINYFKINNTIELSIYRVDNNVYYNLSSKNNLDDWINIIVLEYEKYIACPYKNKIIISGIEQIDYNAQISKIYKYPNLLWAINWYLVEKNNYTKFEYINTYNIELYDKILESCKLYKVKEDFYLSITKKNIMATGTDFKNILNNTLFDIKKNIIVEYILYSNNLNIDDEIKKINDEFIKYTNRKNTNILYHFIYTGMNKDGQLQFKTRILTEKNTDNEIYESFDTIFNEHVDKIKNDIKKLKNIEYYKKRGLRRKLGYLLSGKPGSGKTTFVVASAIEDNRHIVEIPFSILTTHEELDNLINIKTINNINVNGNDLIILFDEIDYGIQKYDINDTQNLNVQTNKNILNLGTILSKFDGINNYNGLIIMATTNNIDKINPTIYRDMRLTLIKIDALRKKDCINIIKTYFNIDNIIDDIIEKIPDKKIFASKLVNLCMMYENNIDGLINELEYFSR